MYISSGIRDAVLNSNGHVEQIEAMDEKIQYIFHKLNYDSIWPGLAH